MRNILVVDDDVSVGTMLTEYLSQHDFEISVATSRAEVRRHLASRTPDLLLVDMNLGEEDGMGIVQDLTTQIDAPIIIMSGHRLGEMDKVTGLELGARDYISKPFSLREVLARIRVALQVTPRRHVPAAKAYLFENWRLSTRHRRLCNPHGQEISLTTNEFNLLVAFLEFAGQVLSREQLLVATRVHDQEILDRSVDVLILRLRRKLEKENGGRNYIVTHRGAGYVFDCKVQVEVAKRVLQ